MTTLTMTFTEVSRYRVHRIKTDYWRERDKLGKLNDMIARLQERYGSRAEAQRQEDYQRLVMYRKSLIGYLHGIEAVFKQFDLEIDKDAPPIVRQDDIYPTKREKRDAEEEMEEARGV